jgi:tetratricopeptide (TPR) repeat protein
MHLRRFLDSTYDSAVSVPDELARARKMAFASDETTAKELLLELMPQIEAADRDDWMMEALAQLGELYLVRTAYEGVREGARRIRECLSVYSSILAGTATPEVAAKLTMTTADVRHMIRRYGRRAGFLETGLAAAIGDHEGAAAALLALDDGDGEFADLADEHVYLLVYARIVCAQALCDDDLHVRSVPLWDAVIQHIETATGSGEFADNLKVLGGIGYARFCIETGRLDAAEPWLRRAEARAEARGWELATARARLERGAASWSAGDRVSTEARMYEAYPVIAEYARANDVSRCWLFFGLTRLSAGGLKVADECWENAERHWRELGKPFHIHRILLQRSWISIFRGRFAEAVDMVAQARECLDSSPRSSWLAYARLDDHLGNVWRAEALSDLGFDGAGDPGEDWDAAEARYRAGSGVTRAEPGTPRHDAAMEKLQRAAELKVPASLAVDSVRYSIADAEARAQWATCVSAPLLASTFAVAWEWENVDLLSQLVEYHSARGTFTAESSEPAPSGWSNVSTAAAPIADVDELALVAAGPPVMDGTGLTRLGPLPPLRMDPTTGPVLNDYRELALKRYGQCVTAAEFTWATWP